MLPKLNTRIPGPKSRALARKLRRYESQNITYIDQKFPIFWERAKGANIWDVDGNCFLDFTCAFGVTTLGHSHPEICGALESQSRKLLHAMGDVHPSDLKPLLCEKLSHITFEKWTKNKRRKLLGKTILCNSGFEAVEAALKTAYLKTKKRGVLAFSGSYHGLGYGAVDTTGWKEFRDPFKKQIANFTTFVPYPYCYRCPFKSHSCARGKWIQGHPACSSECRNELHTLIISKLRDNKIGSILVEPIQGRGGEIIPPAWFLPLLRQVADEYHIPLIFDEIYTGFGRTGSFFACEDNGGQPVIPDIICLGKALTGGFPLSACVGKSELMDEAWPLSTGEAIHTSTFLGNPLGCAMALKSLKIFEKVFHTKKRMALSHSLHAQLIPLMNINPLVGDIRVKGLMAGIELIDHKGSPHSKLCGSIMSESLARGIILLGGGIHHNVISINLSLKSEQKEIIFLVENLKMILAKK